MNTAINIHSAEPTIAELKAQIVELKEQNAKLSIDGLHRAKQYLKQGWKTPKGAKCECCNQLVKLYKRKITAQAAYELICLYKRARLTGQEYHHRNDFIPSKNHSGGDWARLVHWGLIESKVNEDPEKKCSGIWRITDLGIDFVQGNATVPVNCYIYNNVLYGKSPMLCSIKHALGEKFSYPELMGFLI